MKGGGIKLFFMIIIGLLLVEIGITGKLGSLLGSIIDPSNMADSSSNGSNAGGGNTPQAFVASNSTLTKQVQAVFGSYADQALKIANAESTMNPNAYNSINVSGSHAEGLFQILYPSTWNTTSQAAKNPYDPATNIKAAYEIFVRDGFSWREWATAPALGLS